MRSQEAALAWQSEQAEKCPGCGTFGWEWEEDHHAYEAHSTFCFGCMRRASEEQRLQQGQSNTAGYMVELRRRQHREGSS